VTSRRIAVLSLAVGSSGALALAGCGSGGRLSHGDFVQRADAVCTAFRASTERIARPRTYADIVAYVKKTRPMYEAARLRLTALRPPASDEAAVHRWLAADKQISAALGDLGDAALRHDFPAVTAAANRIQAEGVASRHAAQDLGLQVCAEA
jgi:hypothetical protein